MKFSLNVTLITYYKIIPEKVMDLIEFIVFHHFYFFWIYQKEYILFCQLLIAAQLLMNELIIVLKYNFGWRITKFINLKKLHDIRYANSVKSFLNL